MQDEERKEMGPEAEKAYNRMLERVESRLADAEDQTWDTVKKEIDEAVTVEQGLARLTREEIDLLAAYLRRDLQHMVGFIKETGSGVREWLRLDLDLIEHRLAELLLGIADKTQVDTLELDQRIHHDVGQYMTGEIATAGVLRCLQCGHMVCLTDTLRLEPCHECQSHYFERVTARWPHSAETDES
ncbi:zinc ribbon-containing protein [Marinobacteraceae bacterium S3BR75-40.1]